MLATHRPVEVGVPEGEGPAVGGHFPIALPVRGGDHPDDRCIEGLATHRPVEVGIPECEHAAIPGDQPVTPAIGSRSHADDRAVQWHPAGRSKELGRTEGEQPAVRAHFPVALTDWDGELLCRGDGALEVAVTGIVGGERVGARGQLCVAEWGQLPVLAFGPT